MEKQEDRVHLRAYKGCKLPIAPIIRATGKTTWTWAGATNNRLGNSPYTLGFD